MKRFQIYTFLCDCLSIDFHPQKVDLVEKQLRSENMEWGRIISLASNHYVLQLIYRIFKDHQLLEKIPKEVVTEMEKIHSLIESRNQEMLEQCREINLALQGVGINPIFLKGIGYLMQDLYKDMGDRLHADVDILVSFGSLDLAVKTLEKNGFVHLTDLNPKKIPTLKHYPRIFKPGSKVTIELHWEAINPKYRNLLTEEMVMEEKINAINFPECATMSWEHAIQHNFIHSQLEHRAHNLGKVLLRNMYDLVLLSKKANVSEALEVLNLYQKQAASYIVLTEKIFELENLSSNSYRKKVSKLFFFRYKLNINYRIPNLIRRLIARIYHSYIRKFFMSFIDKDLRSQLFKHLSSKKWREHHLESYRKMFRGPRIKK